MRKFLLIFLMTFYLNSAQAVEFKPLEMSNETTPQNEQKALLNDKDYKFKGRVEYDEEGVLLLDSEDVNHMELKINLPRKYPKKSVLSDKEIFSTIEEQRRYETPKIDEYLINPTFGELTYQSGKFSYGTTFGTELDTAQLEYRTKLFTRYDTKRFGIMTAIGKDAYTTSGNQLNSVYIVPEIKLGKGFTHLLMHSKQILKKIDLEMKLYFNTAQKSKIQEKIFHWRPESVRLLITHPVSNITNFQFQQNLNYNFII